MAHNLAYNTVTKKYEMMSRGATWHNLGQIVENATTWEETMNLAGLGWKVEVKPLLTPSGAALPNNFGVFRDDKTDDLEGFLGAVQGRFVPVQNHEAFAFVDALMEADGGAHYESAGALGKGEKVFCLANIGKPFEIVDGDRHETYLCFSNNHNSDASPQVFVTTVRIVCANTLQQALVQDGRSALKLRHTKSVHARMDEAKKLITGGEITAAALRDKLLELSTRKLNRESLSAVLDRLFPKPAPAPAGTVSTASTTRVENKQMALVSLMERNDGGAFKQIEGTAYNLLNAFTEYVDHEIPVVQTAAKTGWNTKEIRSARAMFGDGALDKSKALETILAATRDAPRSNPSVAYSIPSAVIAEPVAAADTDDWSAFEQEIPFK